MDLRHVRTFVTVAEVGTVSRAAERLHVAQPAPLPAYAKVFCEMLADHVRKGFPLPRR